MQNRIKQIRKNAHMDQKEFGKVIAKHLNREKPYWQTAVAYWESNLTSVPLEVIIAISEVFGCDINYILGLSVAAKNQPVLINKENISKYNGHCVFLIPPSIEMGFYGLLYNKENSVCLYDGSMLKLPEIRSNLYLYEGQYSIVNKEELRYTVGSDLFCITVNKESECQDGIYRYDIVYNVMRGVSNNHTLNLYDYYENWIALR